MVARGIDNVTATIGPACRYSMLLQYLANGIKQLATDLTPPIEGANDVKASPGRQ